MPASRSTRPQVQPEATQTTAVDQAPLLAAHRPAAPSPGPPPPARKLREIESALDDLSARVDDLEQAPLPAGATASSAKAPEPSPKCLQELLPEIKNLAAKVGGLERLAAIVNTLK